MPAQTDRGEIQGVLEMVKCERIFVMRIGVLLWKEN